MQKRVQSHQSAESAVIKSSSCSESIRLLIAECKSDHQGFETLEKAHWLFKCCIQKEPIWLVGKCWVAWGGFGVKGWMLRGRAKCSIYKSNLKKHLQNYRIRKCSVVCVYGLLLFTYSRWPSACVALNDQFLSSVARGERAKKMKLPCLFYVGLFSTWLKMKMRQLNILK